MTRVSRRAVLGGAAALVAIGLVPHGALAQNRPGNGPNRTPRPPTKGTRLVMLGTRGGPGINATRGETASAVVVDGTPYLLDCGYGTVRALIASGIGLATVDTIFFSHLHNDHTSDFPALLSHQWTNNKSTPTNIYGPYATASTLQGVLQFMRADVEIRTIDEGRTIRPEDVFFAHDLDVGADPVRVFADDRVIVTAATNTHFPDRATARMAHRSFGYRFDTSGRSIAFSGDTAYSANIVKLARGADVFVCEIIDHAQWQNSVERAKTAAAEGHEENIFRHVSETHSPPADVGRMASEAKVKTVVLNHQLRGAGTGANGFAISAFIDGVHEKFSGEVIVAEDLQVI
jgi:ribonuclease BN (tRNA processing enzyme)